MNRRTSVCLAVVAAAVPTVLGGQAVAQAAPAHARSATAAQAPMGQLLSSEPLARSLWPAGTAAAYRVTYQSSDQVGRPTVVSGSVFVPSVAYTGENAAAGRPVVSWAHETTGLADNCAPSTAGEPAEAQATLGSLLGKGYVVVASDYQGLGTPGEHPFLMGESEAHSVIDIVRAAGQVPGSDASTRWMVAGHSQGGQAALFTGSIATRYAADLDFRGTYATAPISQWRTTLDQAKPLDPAAPGNPYVPLILSGLDTVEPNLFDESQILTPKGMDLYQQARTNLCSPALAATMRAGKGSDFYHFTAADEDRLKDALDRYAEIPIAQYTRPVFIGQGTADTTVYPPASQLTATKLSQAGSGVTFTYYPGATHGTVQQAALTDLLAFAQQRLG